MIVNNVTPWVSCFKPVSIRDCYGRVQTVGCGSCPACQELKRNSLSNRLALEEHRSKYCSFVTLTYDETHLVTMVGLSNSELIHLQAQSAPQK